MTTPHNPNPLPETPLFNDLLYDADIRVRNLYLAYELQQRELIQLQARERGYIEAVKTELRSVSAGQYETWGFVQLFMDILDKVAKEQALFQTQPASATDNKPLTDEEINSGNAMDM